MMFKNNKLILLTFFIAAFLLSCKTLREGVIVAVVTHNIHGNINPSPYRGEFEEYTEPPKKEAPVKVEQSKPTSGPRYRIELTEAGYTLVISKPIVFSPNEMIMNRRYEESIDIVLEFLSDYTNAKLIVEGHPDKSSDISYDYMVSRVRASSVYDELINGGTSENRLLFYQNNTRIDNAGVSLKNTTVKFVIINDKDAYAHYLSYLRNYAIKTPTTLASQGSALPRQLPEPKTTSNGEKSLVLKSGDGDIIAKTTIKKEEPPKKVKQKKEVVAKEKPVKKTKPKKEAVVKEKPVKKVEQPKEVLAIEEAPKHRIKKDGTLNLLLPSEPIVFTQNSFGIPIKYTNSINDIISFMNENTNARLVIEGYGDKTEILNDNLKLSEERGSSLYKALTRSGINKNRLLLHGSDADINNPNVLIDNNGMRFIVIKDRYDYYNYVKYVREYKSKKDNNTLVIKDNKDNYNNDDREIVRAKMINPKGNSDIFEFDKNDNNTKKETVAKKEVEPKKETITKKEVEPKKETITKKEAKPKKQTVAKKEVEPKKETITKKEAKPKKQTIAKKEADTQKEEGVKTPAGYKIEKLGNLKVLSTATPITFENASSIINAKDITSVNAIADIIEFLNDNTNSKLVIEGYGDKTANYNSNIELSKKRGINTYRVLLSNGINEDRLLVYGISDIDNSNILIDNDAMKFVVIDDRYAYYDYIKYLREYKPKVPYAPTNNNIANKEQKSYIPLVENKKNTPTKITEPTKMASSAPEKEAGKKKPTKIASSTPKKETAKKEPVKKEKAPKKTTKKSSSDEEIQEDKLPDYIVEKVNNLNILHPKTPIVFDESVASIPVKNINSINDIIHFMNSNTNARLVVEGYGDKALYGNDKLKLSEERGANVYKILLRSGIDENRLLLHNRNSDINNTNILMNNNGMRFIVIKDKYDYYNYTKYTREYKSPPERLDNSLSSLDNNSSYTKSFTTAKEVSSKGNEDLFDTGKATKQVKTQAPKKEPTPKKVQAKKEPAPKKTATAPKKEPTPKKVQAKKEPAPKKTATAPKKATTPKVEYRVLKSANLYILLEEEPISFANDSSALNQKMYNKSIDYIASFLNASTNSKLIIEGYSDKTGTSNQYVSMSKARGYSVYKKLLDSGIDENRLLLYGSNNDINNAHVLIDNENMRFIIIKDSNAYYDYVNYLKRYIPKARPIQGTPKQPQTQTAVALNNKNTIPLNDPNASIVIITEEEYKKELLAKKEAKTNDKSETGTKKKTTKKEAPTKQAATKKEAPTKQAATKKEAPTKQAATKKEAPTKQTATKKEPVSKKTASSKKNNTTSKSNIAETVAVEGKEYRIELSNGLQVLLPPQSIAFDYQSALLSDRYKNSIKNIADFLKENPNAKMVIEGNAYEAGTDSYNTILSRARANTIYNELLKIGIERNRLLLHSVGNKTINNNSNTPRENRIIRFVIIKNQNDYTRYLDYLKKSGV